MLCKKVSTFLRPNLRQHQQAFTLTEQKHGLTGTKGAVNMLLLDHRRIISWIVLA